MRRDAYGLLTGSASIRRRTLMPGAPNRASEALSEHSIMQDLMWLAVLAGLFLATLAYVRLCDGA